MDKDLPSGTIGAQQHDPVERLQKRLAVLEEDLEQLRHREEIRTVLFRYCRAADRCDLRLMKSCYHDDAEDDHGFFSGPAWSFCDYVIEALKTLDLSVHSLSNILIDLDGTRAFVESQYSVIHRISHFLGFTDYSHQGRYLDVFELRDGQWKIFRRVICQDGERWFQTANMTAITESNPNAPPSGRQDPSDPSYLRFEVGKLIQDRGRLRDNWKGFRRIALLPMWTIRLLTLVLTAIHRH